MSRLLAVLVALLLAVPALAARVELDIDTRTVQVGQTVKLDVRVIDGSPTAVPKLELPDGLVARYAGSRQATTTVLDPRGGRSNMRIVDYSWRITAVREGSYTIGPVTVELGTDSARTETLAVEVVPRAARDKARLKVEAGFDQQKAYEGEVVIYRYRLESRDPILSSRWTLPQFEGLVPPREGDTPRHQYKVDDPDGTILVDETQVPLVATGIGAREYGGAVAQVDLPVDERDRRDPFGFRLYRSKAEVLATGPSKLEIVPLPKAPPGFTGLVGDFVFESRVRDPRVPVGGSVQWEITATGSGTLEGFSLPPVRELEHVRIYDDSPTVSARVLDGEYQAKGTFHRVIVPTREGIFDIPAIEIVAFSPTRGEFVTHQVEPPPLEVVSGGETSAQVESYAPAGDRAAIEPTAPEDIRAIHASGVDHAIRLGPFLPLLVGGAAAPGTLALTLHAVAWWRTRPKRVRVARPVTPRERLDRLPTDPLERLAALDAVLRELLARRAGVPVAALDRDRAMNRLPPDLQEEVRSLTRALDRARFADGRVASDLEARVRALAPKLESK